MGLYGHDGRDTDKADEGDGVELTLALKILDELVKRKMPPLRREGVKLEFKYPVGRYIERYGLDLDDELDRTNDDSEIYGGKSRDEALVLLRRGLTKVYKQIEKRKAEA